MRIFGIIAIFGATLWLAGGCFSLDAAKIKATGAEHVVVSDYGWYLFHFIPLACGNANKDGYMPFVFLRNDVTLDNIQSRFMDYADGREADELSYHTTESVMLEIPGTSLPIPIPYLVTYREIQLSGILR